jgi:parvulin-like peptidyl-prolyl isomerase
LTAAFALTAAACGGSSGDALVATAAGQEISFDEVLEHVFFEGDTLDNELFLRTIRSLIVDHVVTDSASSEFGIVVTDADIDASIVELLDPLMQTDITREEVLQSANVTEAGLRSIATARVIQIAVQDELVALLGSPPDEELMQRYNAELLSVANVCTAHILLETEEGAQAALERTLAGEGFGDVAMDVSTGPSGPDGGDLGCSAPGQFVAEFANATLEAEVGVPFGPVQTQFGYHVILVSERVSPSFEERRDELIANMAAERGQSLWTTWLVSTLKGADVSVEAEYGLWTTDPSPDVLPPVAG